MAFDIAEPAEEVVLDDAGLIAEDVVCHSCQYNLRGLSPDGRCPECGTSVGWSIIGDLLRYSNPTWVRTVATGLLWAIYVVFATIALTIAGSVIDSFVASSIGSAWSGAIAAAVWLVPAWMVTAPDPGKPHQIDPFGMNMFIRYLAIAAFLGDMAIALAVSTFFPGSEVLIMVGGTATSLAELIALILLCILLRRLAYRVPNVALAKQTTIVLWGYIVSYGLMIVMIVPLLMSMPMGGMAPNMSGIMVVAVFGMCTAGISVLVFSIWFIVLLFMYRRDLHRAADHAMTTWMRKNRYATE